MAIDYGKSHCYNICNKWSKKNVQWHHIQGEKSQVFESCERQTKNSPQSGRAVSPLR